MRIALLAVGRLKTGPERELLSRYIERAQALARNLGVSSVTARAIEESRFRTPQERRSQEAKGLRAELPDRCSIVVLDERGRSMSSPDFAERLRRARDAGIADVAVVIGGPDGLDDSLRRDAEFVMAYGAATFPHQLVRILAAEQIYRALTILSHHPYHRS